MDYFHLMLYDFKMYDDTDEAEPGSKLIGHHAPLFSKDWEDEGNKTMTTVSLGESNRLQEKKQVGFRVVCALVNSIDFG